MLPTIKGRPKDLDVRKTWTSERPGPPKDLEVRKAWTSGDLEHLSLYVYVQKADGLQKDVRGNVSVSLYVTLFYLSSKTTVFGPNVHFGENSTKGGQN